MSLRVLALTLFIPFLCSGCMAQRDTPEPETPEMETPEMETETTGGGMTPNGPVYLFGTWDFTVTEIGGEDTISGTLMIGGGADASRVTLPMGWTRPFRSRSWI